MRRPAWELIGALLAVAALTAWYASAVRDGVPSPGGALGHGLGVVGFLLMLATETLYSLRKRLSGFTLGPTQYWLRLHVFTGLVGPYLVLLHTGGRFHGLAGVVTLLTVIVVVSGLVGRFLYTAVPRTLDGVEVAVRDLGAQIAQTGRQLHALGAGPLAQEALKLSALPRRGWVALLAGGRLRRRHGRRLRQLLSGQGGPPAARLEALLTERYRLLLQVRSLAAARRLLALWHTAHVPLGVVLFTLAFVHVGAALYYATFLK
jgi:hypothetical protein